MYGMHKTDGNPGSRFPYNNWFPLQKGLAGHETLVNIFQDMLTLEYGNYPLAKYAVEWQPDDRHLLRVGNPRLYEHPYQSLQQSLWEPGEVEWQAIIRCEPKPQGKSASYDLLFFNRHWILKEQEHKEMNDTMLSRGKVQSFAYISPLRAIRQKRYYVPYN